VRASVRCAASGGRCSRGDVRRSKRDGSNAEVPIVPGVSVLVNFRDFTTNADPPLTADLFGTQGYHKQLL